MTRLWCSKSRRLKVVSSNPIFAGKLPLSTQQKRGTAFESGNDILKYSKENERGGMGSDFYMLRPEYSGPLFPLSLWPLSGGISLRLPYRNQWPDLCGCFVSRLMLIRVAWRGIHVAGQDPPNLLV